MAKEGLEELRNMDLQRIVDMTREFSESGAMFRTVRTQEWIGEGFEEMSWERIAERVGRCEWVR